MPDYKLKTKSLKRLFFGGLVFFFLFSACVPCQAMEILPKRPKDTTIKGQVINSLSNQPLLRAKVKILDASNRDITTSETDTQGRYSVKKRLSGNYVFSCQIEGYTTVSVPKKLDSGKSYTLNFHLQPTPQPRIPPRISSTTPSDGSILYSGETIQISPSINEDATTPLQYQISVDGIIKQTWLNTPTYNWIINNADIGIHRIRIEVRNAQGSNRREVEVAVAARPLIPAEQEVWRNGLER
ncbi:MAG: carboxypeptidase-like regulatory domain-containing protein [Candidatus Omnitrophica bacterium]|nr:carboxypeptidase-like regulatory domain-containing protein [Candidatus Omnitrophota bacterium]